MFSLLVSYANADVYPGGSRYQALENVKIKDRGPGKTPEELLQATANHVMSQVKDASSKAKGTSTWADMISRTEVDLYGSQHRKPRFGVRTIQPLYETLDNKHTYFTQLSYFRESRFGIERSTLNTGFGYRQLAMDDKLMWGLNAFFDYEWPIGHQRASIGAELKSSVFDVNYQEYFGLSGRHSAGEEFEEIPLSGREIEVGVPLPFLPTTRIYYRKYWWDKEMDGGGMRGDRLSFEARLPKGFTAEFGQWDDTKNGARRFGMLRWRWAFGEKKDEELLSSKAFELKSVEKRRLERIRRSNTITVDRQSKGGGRFTVRVVKTG